MLIYRTNKKYLFNLAGVGRAIMYLIKASKLINLEKIPFTFSMAIYIPSNIFAIYWPIAGIERTADCK
jgi:hypothetical protein